MATKIFVDAGHGGTNPGAVGNGVIEANVNLAVATALANNLRNMGYDVREYRTTNDENVITPIAADLRKRAQTANDWGADYFISIHTNANTNPAINGTECYVYSQNNPAFYLAEDIVSQIVRRVGTKDNGVYVRPSLYVLRRTQMPSVLVELAYLTNYEDFVLLTTMQYQFAYGIYNGILNFLGLPFL